MKMNCKNLNFKMPLLITEHLEDVVTDEFTCAIFECKINKDCTYPFKYIWYKNGEYIEPQERIQMSVNGLWFKLEISSVTVQDEGVYSIIITENSSRGFSFANLYIGVVNNSYNSNREVLYMGPMRDGHLVEKCLSNVTVNVGGIIELEVIFSNDAIEDYLWYKSNTLITENNRTIIFNDNKSSALSIMCARETDTGIYHVLSKTNHGISSSFATVVVFDYNFDSINSCKNIPCVLDALPETIEKNEGEETRLTCKAVYDENTVIEWFKNDVPIESNENMVSINNYNLKTVTLRLLNPNLTDTGKYSVLLRHAITGLFDKTCCYLNMNYIPQQSVTSINILRPLKHTISCFGARLLLTCSFDLPDPQYYFVVWYIGQFRVERTNHRFNVFNSGGDFYIFIKHIEPCMAGAMICELYKVLPKQGTILINKTIAHLSIVPRVYIANEIQLRKVFSKQLIFKYPIQQLVIPFKNKKSIYNSVLNTNSLCGAYPVSTHGESVLVITYCRVDVNSFYLDVHAIENNFTDNQLVINKKWENSHSLIMDWNYNNNSRPKSKWYCIEFCQSGREFITAGISSSPMFELKDPPTEQVMRFRITAIDPLASFSELRVCIHPASKELQISKKTCEIQLMETFEDLYSKTGKIIGCGAFGSVMLVHDEQNIYYAAKNLKTRTQKKRDTALREYEILKHLKHPKIVELIDCFMCKDTFVLVMEYLWGGELFDRLVEEDHINEVDVVLYVRQLCEGLDYLHQRRIVHLDLKPENIICLSPNSRQIKIIDFGLARVLQDGTPTRAIYGTRDYIAPEILNYECITLACDMWSLGVVTYMLLSGVLPFTGETWLERSANITRAKYRYDDFAFKEISDLAKNFVDCLLKLRPDSRITAAGVLEHAWIIEGPPDGAKAAHMKRTQENLKSYLANYRAKWQRAGRVMIAAHRLRAHAANHQIAISNADNV